MRLPQAPCPPRQAIPRCAARTRAGPPCRNPAVTGKRRCRMHGGAEGSGAQPGNSNALKHGFYTAEAEAERSRLRAMMKLCERMAEEAERKTRGFEARPTAGEGTTGRDRPGGVRNAARPRYAAADQG